MKKVNWISTVFMCAMALSSEYSFGQDVRDDTKLAQRWVNGSWVNVRVMPGKNSEVITKLTVNTAVSLVDAAAQGDFCEITWGDNQHGFIACSLLGNQPLTIDEVGVAERDVGKRELEANPKYSATRAFWIDPSFARLQDAGRHFEQVMLTPTQREMETINPNSEPSLSSERPKLRRFPVPEFEAMKDLMKKGVVASANYARYPRFTPVPLSELKLTANSKELNSKTKLDGLLNSAGKYAGILDQIELPIIGESYFKKVNEIGRPSASTEELSHHFQIPYSIRILSGASWQSSHYNGLQVYGDWDMGDVNLELTQPLYKNTVSHLGVVKSQLTPVTNEHRFDNEEGENCTTGFQFGGESAEAAPADWKAKLTISDSNIQPGKARKIRQPENLLATIKPQSPDVPLFYFYTKEPFVFENAKVTKTNVQKLKNIPEQQAIGQTYDVFYFSSTKFIDVDKDGTADFAVWEGMRPQGGIDPDENVIEANYRLIFVNVAAQWYLLDHDDYVYACGC